MCKLNVIITPDRMRALEQAHFAAGHPSKDLMGTAAGRMTAVMDALGLVRNKKMLFFCGSGGNGGDGFASAAQCAALGAACTVVLTVPQEKIRGDAAYYLSHLPETVPVVPLSDPDALTSLPKADTCVDCIFGIGLSRPVEGLQAACIAYINACGADIVSCDIASGLDAKTGDILGCAVRADHTVTFQHAKRGHCLRQGIDQTGLLHIEDIGIAPADGTDPTDILLNEPPALPARKRFSHKGTYGRLLIISGSRGMAGAAAICAKAALHSGAGLVTIACPEELTPILQIHAPEAMCLPLPQNDFGAFSAEGIDALAAAISASDAVACGPGLSRHADPGIVRAVLCSGKPAVLDADALNLIAMDPSLAALLSDLHVITPHPGEAKRLIPSTGSEPDDAEALARSGCTAVLKGAVTLIRTDGTTYLSAAGSACQAKGGSGDMLTGITGALLAQGLPPGLAARTACDRHGRAGMLAEKRFGQTYPTAFDVIRCLADIP